MEEEEVFKFEQLKQKEKEKLIAKGGVLNFEEFEKKENKESEIKKDLISKFESFELDNNKKN